jgi:DNA-binding FrmR family transcriptional regulator
MENPDLQKRLRRIRGQIDGIDRMLEEGRYCIDVINQIKAAQAALHGVETLVLEGHLRKCVRSAFKSKNAADVEEKIREILELV